MGDMEKVPKFISFTVTVFCAVCVQLGEIHAEIAELHQQVENKLEIYIITTTKILGYICQVS